MSSFDDLSESQKVAALRQGLRASLGLSIGAFTILAQRGLISPDELSALLKPVMESLENSPSANDETVMKLTDAMAILKKLAAENWKH